MALPPELQNVIAPYLSTEELEYLSLKYPEIPAYTREFQRRLKVEEP